MTVLVAAWSAASTAALLGSGLAARGAAGAGPKAAARGAPGTTAATCARATRAGPAGATVAIRLLRRAPGAVALAAVCLDGSGPYTFAVDSGSGATVVDSGIARQLNLARAGPPGEAEGVGCQVTVAPVHLSSWSVGGVALAPQDVFTASLPLLAGGVRLQGILGGDVLARFAAVRIDYRARTLSLGTGEAPPSSATAAAPHGAAPKPRPVSRRLLTTVRLRAALQVASSAGGVSITTRVTLGGRQRAFVVDTGAEISAVSPSLVDLLHLTPTRGRISLRGVGCTVTAAEFATGGWSVGGTRLASQPVAELPRNGIQVAGLLGSDVLARFGAVVIDYRAAQLLLESG